MDSKDSIVFTQTVERLWRDFKEWTKSPGMGRVPYLVRFRYVYIREYEESALHIFLLKLARLLTPAPDPLNEVDTSDSRNLRNIYKCPRHLIIVFP